MVTCTIIVSHINTPGLLRACLEGIRVSQSPDVETEVLVIDQSDDRVWDQVRSEHKNSDVSLLRCKKVDAGYPIDFGIKRANGQYLCTLDCDAFPVHTSWLLLPIRLIQENGFSMVGHTTGLHRAYPHKGEFFELNNYYRVCKTVDVSFLSDQVGFMRPGARDKAGFVPKNTDYERFVSAGKPPFDPQYADTGVIANWLFDRQRKGTKLSLRLTRSLGRCPRYFDGVFGMVIDDLVFHLGFGYAEDHMPPVELSRLETRLFEVRRAISKDGYVAVRKLLESCRLENEPRQMTRFNPWKIIDAPDAIGLKIAKMKESRK